MAYMACILASSLVPGVGGEEGYGRRAMFMDFLHIPVYSLLTYFLIQSLRSESAAAVFPVGTGSVQVEKSLPEVCRGLWIVGCGLFFAAFTIAVLFGVLNEYVQSITPGREFSVADMLRNALGAAIIGVNSRIYMQRKEL